MRYLSYSPLALSVLLLGCNNSQPPQTDTAVITQETTAPSDQPQTLASVQEIVINNGAEPESLDPHKTNGVPESNLIRQMLVGLTTTDADGQTVPGVAESWTVSDDGTVWTFKLRPSTWSNGEPLTAHDFVYSFRRAIDPATAAPRASYLVDAKIVNAGEILENGANLETLGVRAIDDHTFEITLSEPVPYLADALIHTTLKPVHRASIERFGDKWTDPANIVVNGAYKPSLWQINDRIEMARNTHYYDNANTTIDKVTFVNIGDETAAVNRYLADELSIAGGVPETLFEKLKTERPDELKVAPLLCTYYFETNKAKPPFDNVDVRRALALALDRETITDKVIGMGQTPAYQFAPPKMNGMGETDPDWRAWDETKRIEEAKRLLAKAGYNKTNPLTFELLYNTSESHKKIAAAATSLWKKTLGEVIEVNLVNQEWKTYLDTKRQGDHQMARAGWCAVYNEPSAILNTLRSNNSSNTGKYQSPNYDAKLDQTLRAKDQGERTALYHEAERILDADMPNILVYHYVNTNLVKPYVLGYSIKDPNDNYQVKHLKIAAH